MLLLIDIILFSTIFSKSRYLTQECNVSIIFYIPSLFKNNIRNGIISTFLIWHQIFFKSINQLKNFGITFLAITYFCYLIVRIIYCSKMQLKINQIVTIWWFKPSWWSKSLLVIRLLIALYGTWSLLISGKELLSSLFIKYIHLTI